MSRGWYRYPIQSTIKNHLNGEIYWFLFTQTMMNGLLTFTRWWFQIFFMFTPIWGRFPIWLIFFKRVETTNQFTFDSSTWNSTLKSWPEVVTWDHGRVLSVRKGRNETQWHLLLGGHVDRWCLGFGFQKKITRGRKRTGSKGYNKLFLLFENKYYHFFCLFHFWLSSTFFINKYEMLSFFVWKPVACGLVRMLCIVEDMFIIGSWVRSFYEEVRKGMTMYPQFERSNNKIHSFWQYLLHHDPFQKLGRWWMALVDFCVRVTGGQLYISIGSSNSWDGWKGGMGLINAYEMFWKCAGFILKQS